MKGGAEQPAMQRRSGSHSPDGSVSLTREKSLTSSPNRSGQERTSLPHCDQVVAEEVSRKRFSASGDDMAHIRVRNAEIFRTQDAPKPSPVPASSSSPLAREPGRGCWTASTTEKSEEDPEEMRTRWRRGECRRGPRYLPPHLQKEGKTAEGHNESEEERSAEHEDRMEQRSVRRQRRKTEEEMPLKKRQRTLPFSEQRKFESSPSSSLSTCPKPNSGVTPLPGNSLSKSFFSPEPSASTTVPLGEKREPSHAEWAAHEQNAESYTRAEGKREGGQESFECDVDTREAAPVGHSTSELVNDRKRQRQPRFTFQGGKGKRRGKSTRKRCSEGPRRNARETNSALPPSGHIRGDENQHLLRYLILKFIQPLNLALSVWGEECCRRQLRRHERRRGRGGKAAEPYAATGGTEPERERRPEKRAALGRGGNDTESVDDGEADLFPDAPRVPVEHLTEAYTIFWHMSVSDPRSCRVSYWLFCSLLYVFAHQRLIHRPRLNSLLRLLLPSSSPSSSSAPSLSSSSSSSPASSSSSSLSSSSLFASSSCPSFCATDASPLSSSTSCQKPLQRRDERVQRASAASLHSEAVSEEDGSIPLSSSAPAGTSHAPLSPSDSSSPPVSPTCLLTAPAPVEFVIRLVGVWREYLHFAHALRKMFAPIHDTTASFLRAASPYPFPSPSQHLWKLNAKRETSETRSAARPVLQPHQRDCMQLQMRWGSATHLPSPAASSAGSSRHPSSAKASPGTEANEDNTVLPTEEEQELFGTEETTKDAAKSEREESTDRSSKRGRKEDGFRQTGSLRASCLKKRGREAEGYDSRLATLSPSAVAALVCQNLRSLCPCSVPRIKTDSKEREMREKAGNREKAEPETGDQPRGDEGTLEETKGRKETQANRISPSAVAASAAAMQDAAFPLDSAALRIFRSLLSPDCMLALRASVNFCLKDKRVRAVKEVVRRILPVAPSPSLSSSVSASSFSSSSLSCSASPPPLGRTGSSPLSGTCRPSSTVASSQSPSFSLESGSHLSPSAGKPRCKPGVSSSSPQKRPVTRNSGPLPAPAASSGLAAPSSLALHPLILREALVLLKRVSDYTVPVRLLSLPAWERDQRREEEERERRRQARQRAAEGSDKRREEKKHEGDGRATTSRIRREAQQILDDALKSHEKSEVSLKETAKQKSEAKLVDLGTDSSAISAQVAQNLVQKEIGPTSLTVEPDHLEEGEKWPGSQRGKQRRGVPWGAPQWVGGGVTKSVWDGSIKGSEKFNWWLMRKAGKLYLSIAASLLQTRNLPLPVYVQLALHFLQAESEIDQQCFDPQARESLQSAVAAALLRFPIHHVLNLPPGLRSLLYSGDWDTLRLLFTVLRRWPEDAFTRFVAECRLYWISRFSFALSLSHHPHCSPDPSHDSVKSSFSSKSIFSASCASASSSSLSCSGTSALAMPVSVPRGSLPLSYLVARLSSLVEERAKTEKELTRHFGDHQALRQARDDAFQTVLNGSNFASILSTYQGLPVTPSDTQFTASLSSSSSSSAVLPSLPSFSDARPYAPACLHTPSLTPSPSSSSSSSFSTSSSSRLSESTASDLDASLLKGKETLPLSLFLQTPSASLSSFFLLLPSLFPLSRASSTSPPSLLLSAAVVDYIDQTLREDPRVSDIHARTAESKRAGDGIGRTSNVEREAEKRDCITEKTRPLDTSQGHWLASICQVVQHLQDRETFCGLFRLRLARRLLSNALRVPGVSTRLHDDFRSLVSPSASPRFTRVISLLSPPTFGGPSDPDDSREQLRKEHVEEKEALRLGQEGFSEGEGQDEHVTSCLELDDGPSGHARRMEIPGAHAKARNSCATIGHPGTGEDSARTGAEEGETKATRKEHGERDKQLEAEETERLNEDLECSKRRPVPSTSNAHTFVCSSRLFGRRREGVEPCKVRRTYEEINEQGKTGEGMCSQLETQTPEEEEAKEAVLCLHSEMQFRGEKRRSNGELDARGPGSRNQEQREKARLKMEQRVAQAVLEAAVGDFSRQQEGWKLRQMFEDLAVAVHVREAFEQAQRDTEEKSEKEDRRKTQTSWKPKLHAVQPEETTCTAEERGESQCVAMHTQAGELGKLPRDSLTPLNSRPRRNTQLLSSASTVTSFDSSVPFPSSNVLFRPLILTQHAWAHALPPSDLYLPSPASPSSVDESGTSVSVPSLSGSTLTLSSSSSTPARRGGSPRAATAAHACTPLRDFQEQLIVIGQTETGGTEPLHPGVEEKINDEAMKPEKTRDYQVLSVMRVGDLWLPRHIGIPLKKFTEFYKTRFAERRLTWHIRLSRMQLHCYDNNATRKHIRTPDAQNVVSSSTLLNVPAVVGCILLLFNTRTTLSMQEISKYTGLAEWEVKKVLVSLLAPPQQLLLLLAADVKALDVAGKGHCFSSAEEKQDIPRLLSTKGGSDTGEVDEEEEMRGNGQRLSCDAEQRRQEKKAMEPITEECRVASPCVSLLQLWRQMRENAEMKFSLNEGFFALPRGNCEAVDIHPIEDAAFTLLTRDADGRKTSSEACRLLSSHPLFAAYSSLLPPDVFAASSISVPATSSLSGLAFSRPDFARVSSQNDSLPCACSSLSLSLDSPAFLEAAIVRILKRHRRLSHSDLFDRVQLCVRSKHSTASRREQEVVDRLKKSLASREEIRNDETEATTTREAQETAVVNRAEVPPPHRMNEGTGSTCHGLLSLPRSTKRMRTARTESPEFAGKETKNDQLELDPGQTPLPRRPLRDASLASGPINEAGETEKPARWREKDRTRCGNGEGGDNGACLGSAEAEQKPYTGNEDDREQKVSQIHGAAVKGSVSSVEMENSSKEPKLRREENVQSDTTCVSVPMAVFKKRLESLVEREFIARDERDP
ncbi:UNVERIFIED_CONTAM: hypothetical protein HHA_285445 [Hammondia hammondi]|eukprot:XP_008884187.1 hypothetical protein HHA_285445 [Hammondia hammondi]